MITQQVCEVAGLPTPSRPEAAEAGMPAVRGAGAAEPCAVLGVPASVTHDRSAQGSGSRRTLTDGTAPARAPHAGDRVESPHCPHHRGQETER